MDKPDSQDLDILPKRPEPEPKKKIQKAEKHFNIQILIKTLNQSINSTGDKVATSLATKTFTASASTASTGLNKASDSGVATNNSFPATASSSQSQSSAVISHSDDLVLLKGLFRCGDHCNVNIHLTEIQCSNEKCRTHSLISKQPFTLQDHFAEIGIGTVEDNLDNEEISAESSTISTTKMTNQTVKNKEPELPEGQSEPEQYQGDDGEATDNHESFIEVEPVEDAGNFQHLYTVPGVAAHTNFCRSSEESSQSLGRTEPVPVIASALPPLAVPAALKTTSSTGTVTVSTSASNLNDCVSRFATLEREEKLPMMLRHQQFYLQDRTAGRKAISFGLKSEQKQMSSQAPEPEYKYATIQILESDELNAKAKMNDIVSNKSEENTATTKSTVERKHLLQRSNNIVSSVSTSTTSVTGRTGPGVSSVESDGHGASDASVDSNFNTSSGSPKARSLNSALTSTSTQMSTKRKRSTTVENLDDNNDNDDDKKITQAAQIKNYDSYFDVVMNSKNTKRIITCKLCKMTIPDITAVEVNKMVHIKKHFYPELFHCSICKTDYKFRTSLERHCRLSPAHAINLKSKKEAKKKQKQKKNVETSFRFRT